MLLAFKSHVCVLTASCVEFKYELRVRFIDHQNNKAIWRGIKSNHIQKQNSLSFLLIQLHTVIYKDRENQAKVESYVTNAEVSFNF